MWRLTCLLLIGLSFLSAENAIGADSERPNVVLIFIDDMGFGDVGFNGATGPKTPNLDRMAKEGMQFNDFYVGCAVCSGSRTALMTGTHYQRLNMRAVLFPNSTAGLHPSEVTIADMLLGAGYSTTCIGKWHLGHLPPCLPTYQGFQSYYGIPYSNDMWIDPANKLAEDIVLREGITLEQLRAGHKLKNRVPLMRDEEVIEYPVDQSTVTKRYTEEAVRFIHQKKDEPFFIYLPHTMVHLPLAVSDAFKNRTGKLIWDAIEEVDWSVGEILSALKEAGIDDKTLVIFTSDNGAAVGSSLPLRAKKGSVYDGGIREPTVMRWPGKIPAGQICREVAASIDVLPTLAKLCGGKLPDRKIDGHDIWPLMSGQEGAVSPHETYCLMHGPGTVRSGKWKYYPWPDNGSGKPGNKSQRQNRKQAGQPKVQLYDTVSDIGETQNLAEQHPEIVQKLQAAWEAHNKELDANRRPNAPMPRPSDAPSADRPGTASVGKGKPIEWSKVKAGDVFSNRSAINVENKAFSVTCEVSGQELAGVVLAHGGLVTGYSLYVKEQMVVFALRRTKEIIDRVEAPLKDGGAHQIVASVKKGQLLLQIDSDDPVATTSRGLLQKHPSEDLCIGLDNRMPVDSQSPKGKFSGTIKSVRVATEGKR